jgi:hypothetical protein
MEVQTEELVGLEVDGVLDGRCPATPEILRPALS